MEFNATVTIETHSDIKDKLESAFHVYAANLKQKNIRLKKKEFFTFILQSGLSQCTEENLLTFIQSINHNSKN